MYDMDVENTFGRILVTINFISPSKYVPCERSTNDSKSVSVHLQADLRDLCKHQQEDCSAK